MQKLSILNPGNLGRSFTTMYSNPQYTFEGMMASMKCLVCGHKLAIFRKLSLGDFCCQEHRALFIKEQSDRGLARLMEPAAESRNLAGATRVYAQFLLDEVPARQDGPGWLGYGPLAPTRVAAPEPGPKPFARLAPARHTEIVAPHPGPTAAIGFGVIGLSLRFPANAPAHIRDASTRLRPAGLVLPWSSQTGSQAVFSLAPLAAAAWAQSGFCKPISAHHRPVGELQFAWPTIEGKLELPAAEMEIVPAAFAAVAAPASQPMHVRLATPSVARPKPKLE